MEIHGQYHLLESGGRFILRGLSEKPDQDVPASSCAKSAVIMLDARGCVTRWNQGAEAIYGYTSAEARGQNIYHFLTSHEATAGDFERKLNSAFHEGKSQFRYDFNRKDGTQFLGSGEIKPVWHRSDFLGYLVAVNPQSQRSDA